MSRPALPGGAAHGPAIVEQIIPVGMPSNGPLERFLSTARRSPGVGSHLTIAVLLGVILCVCLRTGIVPTRSYQHDIVSFADNAWRVLWGQRPHVDYSSGLGPVTYLIWAFGIKLAGGSLNGLGYGIGLAGIAIGIWAYLLLVKRVSGWVAVAGATMLCLLALAPVQLGESFRLSAIAMSYNREGYALLGLLIIESFPLRRADIDRGIGGALSTGAVCGILLFLKANYFLVGVVLAGASLVWTGRLDRRRLAPMAASFGVVATAFLAYLHFNVGAILADLRMAADARNGALSKAFILQVFAENFPAFLILAGLALMTQFADSSRGSPHPDRGWVGRLLNFRPLALTTAIFVAGVMLLVSNCQLERLPLHELMALLFLDCLLWSWRLDAGHVAVLCLMGLGLILGTQSSDPLALANGLRLKLHPPTEWAYPVTEGGYKGAILIDDYLDNRGTRRAWGSFLALYLRDGMNLLRRELRPGEKVMTMDTFNPFPFALGIEPPHGGMQSATYKYFYSDRIHLSPEAFFGNADVVMYPKEHEIPQEGWEGLEKYYIPEMKRRFELAAESEIWQMYRRRK